VLSFAEGLRAALREDPDVVMLGEMRDLASISAALTLARNGAFGSNDFAYEVSSRNRGQNCGRISSEPTAAGQNSAF